MRAFMKAIGGLFKSSSSRSSRKSQHPNANMRRGGPAMCTLVPVEDIQLVMPDVSRASTRSSRGFADSRRRSSAYERPQFLFFCGSDNSGVSAQRRAGYSSNVPTKDMSFATGELQPRPSYINSPTANRKIAAPMISHRIPVFFTPQPAVTATFE